MDDDRPGLLKAFIHIVGCNKGSYINIRTAAELDVKAHAQKEMEARPPTFRMAGI